jgi:hypothetical protein
MGSGDEIFQPVGRGGAVTQSTVFKETVEDVDAVAIAEADGGAIENAEEAGVIEGEGKGIGIERGEDARRAGGEEEGFDEFVVGDVVEAHGADMVDAGVGFELVAGVRGPTGGRAPGQGIEQRVGKEERVVAEVAGPESPRFLE